MKRTAWFERKFPPIDDNGLLPSIIERLAGTPARVEEMTRHIPAVLQTQKRQGEWSIKEELGHLSDMEPLWLGRVDDLVNAAPELTVADLTNRRTHEANHNATDIEVLARRFREERAKLVARLRSLTGEQLLHTSLHPRLKTPMRVIDLAYFVAEHDDYHLAAIREKMAAAS